MAGDHRRHHRMEHRQGVVVGRRRTGAADQAVPSLRSRGDELVLVGRGQWGEYSAFTCQADPGLRSPRPRPRPWASLPASFIYLPVWAAAFPRTTGITARDTVRPSSSALKTYSCLDVVASLFAVRA